VAGVPRIIPSDYSLDFTKFSLGENRNLDLRREFHGYLDKTSISATTIFNGAFAHLLTDQRPLILFKQKRVLNWGDADHRMGFTTIEDTATFTANAALGQAPPRYFHSMTAMELYLPSPCSRIFLQRHLRHLLHLHAGKSEFLHYLS